ncbi:MAG TPA: S8 family serine peptidase [Thermoanaerobaculia bacterium]|nr:S8 family serine peptidase [Thermoanaerobaculia bacterium]
MGMQERAEDFEESPQRTYVVLELSEPVPDDADPGEFLAAQQIVLSAVTHALDGGTPKSAQAIWTAPSSTLAVLYKRLSHTDTEPPNLRKYVYIAVPEGTDAEKVRAQLAEYPAVKHAYVERPASLPSVVANDDPLSPRQGYLRTAPEGVDAEYAWTIRGGDGAGVKFVDLEFAWKLDHADLQAQHVTFLGGTRDTAFKSVQHGTNTLGVVCARDNTQGVVGIAPNAQVAVVSAYNRPRVDAIVEALAFLEFGDVLLIEQQVDPVPNLFVPVEAYDADFDAIRLATALGIVVVEAGGNGSNGAPPAVNMDTWTDPRGRRLFDPAFRDSGAIIVSAADSAATHGRINYAPFGMRIDCFAWGKDVVTTGITPSGADNYVTDYAGTSSASAIVAGAAVAVQGMARAAGRRFAPRELRQILREHGTKRAPGLKHIGAMPDLRDIAMNVLRVAPDVFLRDHAGDTGQPHAGAIASPDIIVQQAPAANPQVSFGGGAAVASNVKSGQDNYVYIRASNRGGSAAANVTATVFFADAASLTNANLWTRIGSVTIPSVPMGAGLTVSGVIPWPAAAVPAPGAYTLVAVIGNAQEPPPSPGDLTSAANFERFIRDNNNATARDVNVIA